MKESELILKTRLVKIINIAKDIIVNAPINAALKLLKAEYRTSLTLFKDISYNLTVLPSFKPQYEVYFERHGFPQEGVFDSEKLAIIIKELLDNGTLTEDDVFKEDDVF